ADADASTDAADAADGTDAAPAGDAPASADAPTDQPKRQDMTPAACAHELKQRFPALFSGAFKPLKLRIQQDIQERAPGVFTKQTLSGFFRRHTRSTPYLMALSRATQRFDLDGEPAGELSEEHRNAATEELTRRRASQQARRAEEETRLAEEEGQRRQRASLLRDFQSTTLTQANFCALKGIAPDALEGLLATARQEAEERARNPPPFQPPRRGDGRNDNRNDHRNDGRGAPRNDPRGAAPRADNNAPREPRADAGRPDQRGPRGPRRDQPGAGRPPSRGNNRPRSG
ncbi:MAG: hypothetical protein JWP52_3207, partial [Rhizobacter sp.]|nr:hypothetical protein [Rhizobacter sp.]